MSRLLLSPKKRPRIDSNANGHPLYGDALEKLRTDRLPTKLEVVNHVRFVKGSYSQNDLTSAVKFGIYCGVANTLLSIYKSAYIPTFDSNPNYAATKLRVDIEKELSDFSKSSSEFLDSPEFRNLHLAELKKVFHLLIKCKCFVDAKTPEEITRANCSCTGKNQDNKIPCIEFYKDQCFARSQPILFCEEDKARFEEFLKSKLENFQNLL